MRKWLSIFGIIGLTATSTTTLISCEKPKPNNNSENGGNKPTPTPEPQQPPENSNWKLIDSSLDKKREEFKNINNKYYIITYKLNPTYRVEKFIFNREILTPDDNIYVNNVYFGLANINIYRWDNTNEPEIPTINNKTGEITDWKK